MIKHQSRRSDTPPQADAQGLLDGLLEQLADRAVSARVRTWAGSLLTDGEAASGSTQGPGRRDQ